MRTQNKENYYYMFWIVAMIAFIAPQVLAALTEIMVECNFK